MVKNVTIENIETEVLTAPTGTVYAGVGLYLCNTSAFDDVINVNLVMAGEGPETGNIILKDLTVKAGETFEFGYEKLILNEGESLYVSSITGSRIRATVTYITIG